MRSVIPATLILGIVKSVAVHLYIYKKVPFVFEHFNFKISSLASVVFTLVETVSGYNYTLTKKIVVSVIFTWLSFTMSIC